MEKIEVLIKSEFFQEVSGFNERFSNDTELKLQVLFDDFIQQVANVCDKNKNGRIILRTLNFTKIRLQALQECSYEAKKKCARLYSEIHRACDSIHSGGNQFLSMQPGISRVFYRTDSGYFTPVLVR